ncbi:uncharacterized protein LOC117653241 isoform X16 [Thrips palmi]|uniref:Uncharacterized protein LOC117653241 isoform X16 n=1 Tax=Thrips palmi TaxID=161013 RepID=A0A6P9ABB0_THRPL|nr:uncharacterized protein LOC117653241 isoform X16 [Thrips palmi]
MAGVVKGVQQVVSSCPNGTTGSTANSNQCDAFSSDPDPLNGVVDNFSFSAEVNTNNDLLGLHPASTPSSDDLSLQDLIDSELALRISSGKAANDSNQDGLLLDLSEDGDESEEVNSVERRPDYVNGVNGVNGVVNGNLVSDFLDRERSHTDLTDDNDNDNAHAETDGDESLSLSKSLSSNAAPLCSGEGEELDDLDMASELGSDGPADSDFSANVPDGQAARPGLGDAVLEQAEQDTEEEADEATLAEDISLASDRSQERTGSLLDLDPLRPDSPPGCGPGAAPGSAGGGSGSGVGLVLGPTDTGPTGTAGTGTAGTSSEQQPGEDEAGEAREGEGRSTTPLGSLLAPGPCSPCSGDGLSAAATAAPPPHAQEQEQQDAEESDKSKLQDDDGGLLLQPLESPDHVPSPSPDLCVDANRDASVLSEDNSMDSSVLSAVPSGPGPDPAGFEEGFETWSTVEEAVNDTDLLAGTAGTNGQVQDEVAPQPENRASPDLDTESVSETSEKKTVSKKKKTDGTESTKKKSRKSKKSDEKENISVKSSFSKFDQLSKKTVLHVRSVDASKVQKQFNEASSTSPEAQTNCKACGKQVFVMEQIKAEKSVWHKNCFRCKECSKQLTVDIYSSNEGDIYCKPHFRELFKPKAVVEDSPEPIRRRKPELIIRENQPVELPPDVVRASDKPDLGLEELSSLNVKSRFQVFEKTDDRSLEVEKSPSNVNVKRSPSILSKLAKFQAKGMDIGVTDESLNGIPYEESSTSSEEEEDDGEGEEEDGDIVKSRRATRERPMSFSKMEDVKSRWETGSTAKKEERREERRQEIQTIRSRLFMGKQGKMKEMYEQAVKESEQPAARRGAEVRSEKAKSIKEKFERGETLVSDGEEGEDGDRKIKDEDLGVFEAGISKKSRSHFMELDASAAKTAQQTTPSRPAAKDGNKKREVLTNQSSSEVVKASDKIEDVQVETADISSKFKFFETYKAPEKQKKAFRITPPREGQVKVNYCCTESPEREVYRDPDVVRADDSIEGDELQHSMTTSKMLSIFRQMEEKAQRDDVPDGPKPLKCFTPPPDYKPESDSSEDDRSDEDDDEDDEEGDEDESDGVIRSSVKAEDEFLQAAKAAAKAKTLRAKFEHWEEQENNINSGGGNINPTLLESEHESIESTKSLRARFESLRNEAEAPKEKPRPKVNRFVEIQTSCAEFCDSCEKKVYPLEKVETGGKLFHKGCFRCMQCSCILRMESYTLNNGKLYCIPHFKQLFISKGNYDEGFGLDQHKRKWNSTMKENGDILLSGIDANGNNH